VAAQQTLRQITQSVGTQLELGTDKPIAGMRELETAIRQMRAAYFELNGEEKVKIKCKNFNKRVASKIIRYGFFNINNANSPK
jgi:hypothetical protein